MDTENYAIQINALWKRYQKNHVLNGLSMQVPMGKIYGLLGPSGCGKTTLLKCIVGRLRPDSGTVRVMGQRPGKPGHGVPGRLIGYMPQDLALHQEFTISEILYYFGRIFFMPSCEIEARISFLAALLNLPNKKKIIRQLSGGQQRRVSFACALLHQPPLLILDEPTVGVDPVLRQCIWYHLLSLVNNSEKPTSVVITTHYIEEARQSHMVAMMRGGELLAESSPDSLLNLYGETSLEAVFLRLCRTNSRNIPGDHSAPSKASIKDADKTDDSSSSSSSEKSPDATVAYRDSVPFAECARSAFCPPPSPRRVRSVIMKDVTNLRRRLGFLLFQLSMPVLQIVLFCICIGGTPFGLRLAVVNLDGPDGWGARFVNYLDNTTMNKASFADLESAQREVRSALAWAVVHLGQNFTNNLQRRLLFPMLTSSSAAGLADSSIHLQLDNSNYQVSWVLRQSVAESLRRFANDLLKENGIEPSLISPPLIIEPPLLGSQNATFTEFMAPGIIVSIIFFMATGLTALTFVLERKEGLLDRSIVAGMSALEVLLGHMITHLFVMAGQTAFLLLFCLLVFNIPCHGSVLLMILLSLASGFTGMSLGLLISALCTAETAAIQVVVATMYPSLLLSGIIWPIEAMPAALRCVSAVMPTTLFVEALRSVMSRGFGIASFTVWIGLVSSMGWSIGLMFLGILLLKIRGL